nr:unnamed protein product [Callosobruchus chinensis]
MLCVLVVNAASEPETSTTSSLNEIKEVKSGNDLSDFNYKKGLEGLEEVTERLGGLARRLMVVRNKITRM